MSRRINGLTPAARRREHQIRRLDVTMDQSVLMGVLQAYGCLANQFACVGYAQRSDLTDHGG